MITAAMVAAFALGSTPALAGSEDYSDFRAWKELSPLQLLVDRVLSYLG